MNPSNQPHGAWNSSEKSGMLQPTPPPAYQDIPAGYPQSFPSQPVPQGPYAQGPNPEQSVVSWVAVQPTVFVTAAPLANPVPDYLCYSIFTMLFCCLPLGIAALVFSCSTRDANMFGHQPIASRNSRMAFILNHVSVAIGIILWLSFIIYMIIFVIAIKNI